MPEDQVPHYYVMPRDIYAFLCANYHDGIIEASVKHYNQNKCLPTYLWDGVNEYNVRKEYGLYCLRLAQSLLEEGVS